MSHCFHVFHHVSRSKNDNTYLIRSHYRQNVISSKTIIKVVLYVKNYTCHLQAEYHGTLKPVDNFNAAEDAEALKKSMKGFGRTTLSFCSLNSSGTKPERRIVIVTVSLFSFCCCCCLFFRLFFSHLFIYLFFTTKAGRLQKAKIKFKVNKFYSLRNQYDNWVIHK